jgi:hypothetical protein
MSTRRITAQELRYIVNHVWIPWVQYRMQLNSSLKIAEHIDKVIRETAKHTLRLPHGLPLAVCHDTFQGLGLRSCVDACTTARVQLALRVLDTPHVPAYHLLVEALEDYQARAGLTENPIAHAIAPPSHLQQWVRQTIRAAAKLGISVHTAWRNPAKCCTSRPNDRSV